MCSESNQNGRVSSDVVIVESLFSVGGWSFILSKLITMNFESLALVPTYSVFYVISRKFVLWECVEKNERFDFYLEQRCAILFCLRLGRSVTDK